MTSHQSEAILDAFVIGQNHANHSHLGGIIRLEESRRVFCPYCLEENPMNNLNTLDGKTFSQYIENLLEALDQNSETASVRGIVLKVLEIICKRRTIIIRGDVEFHNFIRISYKLIKSDHFSVNEYFSLAHIFSIVASVYMKTSSLPFISIWKISQFMLDFAKKNLVNNRFNTIYDESECDLFKLIVGALRILKTCLQILGKYAIDSIGELVFPLFENNDPDSYSRKYYKEGQLNCLNFMKDHVIPVCWPQFGSIEQSLTSMGKNLVVDLFDALKECFRTAARIKHNGFLAMITRLDCINVSHLLIYRNPDTDLKNSIKAFLKVLTVYYVKVHFGSDDKFNEYNENQHDIVETNHRNAISYSTDEIRKKKTIFYTLINFVALKQNSAYYNSSRVRRFYKSIDLNRLKLIDSDVWMKANLFNIINIVDDYQSIDSIKEFLVEIWSRTGRSPKFDSLFCFERKVFFWNYRFIDTFGENVTASTIESITAKSLESGTIFNDLRLLLEHKFYSRLLIKFFESNEKALAIVREIVNYETAASSNSINQEYLVREVGKALYACLQQSVVVSYTNMTTRDSSTVNHAQNLRLMSSLVLLMKNAKQSRFNPDNQYIIDIFNFANELYQKDETDGVAGKFLTQLNEFFIILIESNSPCLMKVLKYLDRILPLHMYRLLSDYTQGDQLAESIARLILVYDSLDYPLIYDNRLRLAPMIASIINWSFYGNRDLHVLSLLMAQKVLSIGKKSSTKLAVTTGLIHMITIDPEVLQNKYHLKLFLSLCELDVLKYHPMIDYIFTIEQIPHGIKDELARKLDCAQRVVSSPLPFSPAESATGENVDGTFGEGDDEDQVFVRNLIERLGEEDRTNYDRIPDNLYISHGTRDQHTNVNNFEYWEQLATQANEQELEIV